MTPEEAAAWVGEHRKDLRRVEQFFCDCKRSKPIAVVWADSAGGMLLWMAGRTLTDQSGESKRRPATAVRLDPSAPTSANLATCPHCHRGQVIGVRQGQPKTIARTEPPTRGRVVE